MGLGQRLALAFNESVQPMLLDLLRGDLHKAREPQQ